MTPPTTATGRVATGTDAMVAEHRLNRPNRTGETRAYRHHDRNHDEQ